MAVLTSKASKKVGKLLLVNMVKATLRIDAMFDSLKNFKIIRNE